MFLRLLVLAALVVPAVTLTSAPLPPGRGKSEFKAVQGNWRASTWMRWFRTRGGELSFEEPPRDQRMNLIIEGERLKLYLGEEVLVDSVFRLDGSKTPGWIDFDRVDAGVVRGCEGIYRLEANGLLLSIGPKGGRPRDFFKGHQVGDELFQFRRVRK